MLAQNHKQMQHTAKPFDKQAHTKMAEMIEKQKYASQSTAALDKQRQQFPQPVGKSGEKSAPERKNTPLARIAAIVCNQDSARWHQLDNNGIMRYYRSSPTTYDANIQFERNYMGSR